MTTTLLITGIAGDIAQATARIVRQVRPHWRLVGVDVHERHGGELFVDAVEVVPRVAEAAYAAQMAGIVDRHRVDLCLPLSEAELGYFATHGAISLHGAPLLGVSSRAVSVGLDKLATAEFLGICGLPAPWTVDATSGVDPPALPCIFKPRRSAGSRGVAVCRNVDEARWHRSQVEGGIFQELLLPASREVTCAVYRDRSGATAVLAMLRELVGGYTGWAEVLDEPAVTRQCVVLAEALDLRGPMNVQMRLTEHGPRVFEINPRLSSTVYLRHLLGFRDVEWLLDEHEGLPIESAGVPAGTVAVRVQDAAVLRRPLNAKGRPSS